MASRTLRRRSSYRALNGHKRDRPRPLLRVLLVIFVLFMMLTSGASAGTILFYGESLPTPQDFARQLEFQNTVLYANDGHTVLANLANLNKGRRVVEPLVDRSHPASYFTSHGEPWLVGADSGRGIPLALQDATIATEDASFYNNPGFDPLSIARAAFDDVTRGHVVSGASTITQQLIKYYLLGSSKTLTRKLEEVVLAAELTQKYPKSKILWYYLNSVPYGNLAIGAEAAAQTYFHTDVWNLKPWECALLAGLPEAPSTYNPVNNRPAAFARMRYVLHLMYIHGYLRDAQGHSDPSLITQYMSEAQHYPPFTPPQVSEKDPHFVQYAVDQLQQIPQLRHKIYKGLEVITTLDPALQQMAQSTVTNQINQLGALNVTDGALVSMDLRPQCYGCVLAMVGSADYNNRAISGQINMAVTPRQPGSSFKPFNYEYAFEHGLSPATTVLDGPLAIPDTGNSADGGWYEPTDYDQTWHGIVTLRVALANSLNVPAVKVEQFGASQASPPTVRASVGQNAVKLGVTSLLKDNPSCCGWALTLGGLPAGVRLVEETSAYGTFATNGRRVPPIAIRKVIDRSTGKVLYDATGMMNQEISAAPVIGPSFAYEMTNVLSDDNSRCTSQVCEFGLHSDLWLGRPAAAKTGTPNNFTDNWTVGYTPQIVTGVWVGNANGSHMFNTTGITGAAPIWNYYMLHAFSILKLPPQDFHQPTGVYYGSECQQPTGYGGTVMSSFGYDIYAGSTPFCSVGTQSTYLPVPPPQQSAPPVPAAPAPAAPPAAAPTAASPATVAPATQAPPVAQPSRAAPVTQPTP